MIAPPASRAEYVKRIRDQHLAPLWDVLGGLVTAEPKTRHRAVPLALPRRPPDAARVGRQIITAKEAERRVLVLENPNLPGESKITNSLFGGFQLIMPGEVAPPHRHIQAALRFIIEGNGAYTAVDGERTLMQPGDFVITPSWTYHDHGNDTDGADGVARRPRHAHGAACSKRASARAGSTRIRSSRRSPSSTPIHRYGANMVPVEHSHAPQTSPIFSYPYDRTREALEALRAPKIRSPWFGYKMRYINPLTGGDAIPTISTFMQLLPDGLRPPSRTAPPTARCSCRSKAPARRRVGDVTFDWEPHDIIVVPSWMKYTHTANGDAVIFSYSDRGPQELLGFWRDEK